MRILLDHCVPKRLQRYLPAHDVKTCREMGWERLRNGSLLDAAQIDFDLLLTVDQNLSFQQNITGRPIIVVVLVALNNRLDTVAALLPEFEQQLPSFLPGHTYEIGAPATGDDSPSPSNSGGP